MRIYGNLTTPSIAQGRTQQPASPSFGEEKKLVTNIEVQELPHGGTYVSGDVDGVTKGLSFCDKVTKFEAIARFFERFIEHKPRK